MGACHFDPSGLPASNEGAADADTPAADSAVPGPDGMARPFCDAGNTDLVACYRFDDSTGNDQSQYGNHLTASNILFIPGQTGMALQTSAVSSVSAAESASLDVSALTIEMWVNPELLPETGRAALLDNNNQYGLFLDTGNLVRCTSSIRAEAPYPLPIGQWTHLACTNDGAQLALWVNGEMKSSVTAGAVSTGGNDGMAVAMNSPSGDNFTGALDDIRVWRVARTPGEICAAAGASCAAP
jgi:biopolymer transport protein ExbB